MLSTPGSTLGLDRRTQLVRFHWNSMIPKTALLRTVIPALLLAFPTEASQLQWMGRAEGIPSSQVHAIEQTGDGVLWLATPAGLARFDGVRVQTLARNDGLSTQGIRSLRVDQRGTLWVGGDEGVDVVSLGERPRPLTRDWRWGFVDQIAFTPNGEAWLASGSGLLHWTPAAGVSEPNIPAMGDSLIADVETGGGMIWVATVRGLFRSASGAEFRAVESPELSALGTIRTLHRGDDGLFVGGSGGLVWLADQPDTPTRTLIRGTTGAGVSAVFQAGEELLVGVEGGLRSVHNWRSNSPPSKALEDGALVNDLFEDSFGNIWAATDSAGVARMSALRTALGVASMPCPTQVYTIAADDDGGFLIGGESCSWIADRELGVTRVLQSLDHLKVWDLLRSQNAQRSGEIWAATEAGFYRLRGESAARVGAGAAVLEAPGRVLLEDATGIWMGSILGLVREEAGRIEEVLDPRGERLGYVYTLVEDPAGGLWIGTIGRGIFHWDSLAGITQPIPQVDHGNVYAVAPGTGTTLVLLHDSQALLWDGYRLSILDLGEPAGESIAGWAVRFEGADVVWIGGNSGLIRHEISQHRTQRFTANLGLAGNEFTTSRSLLRTPDGRLLQGTDGGLSWLRYEGMNDLLSAPRIRLAEVRWQGAEASAEVDGTLSVQQGRWTLEVDLAAPWFIDPTSLFSRTLLAGFDDEWSTLQPLRDRDLRFTGLPPGTYELRAQASSPLVGDGPQASVLRLRVLPYWWNTLAARLLAVVLLAAAIAFLLRWRSKNLMRRTERLEELVRQRTRELEMLAGHDQLTGLPNRRTFHEQAERLIAAGQRHGEVFSLIMIDLDGFKRLNDREGHQAGDQALVETAKTLDQVRRRDDLLARFGGDEFVVLCPSTSEAEAEHAAERQRRALENKKIGDGLTASFGLATWKPGETLDQLFHRADDAAYAAKESTNRVCRWSPELAENSPGSGGLRQL